VSNITHTFPNFEAWLASFSTTGDQENFDYFSLWHSGILDKKTMIKARQKVTQGEVSSQPRIRRIISDLEKPGSPILCFRQRYLPLNTETVDALRELKFRGMLVDILN
jgi:hypothetical protein